MMGVCCVEGYRGGDMVIGAVMVVYVVSMVKSLGTVVLGDVVLVSAMLISIVSGDLVMEGGGGRVGVYYVVGDSVRGCRVEGYRGGVNCVKGHSGVGCGAGDCCEGRYM